MGTLASEVGNIRALHLQKLLVKIGFDSHKWIVKSSTFSAQSSDYDKFNLPKIKVLQKSLGTWTVHGGGFRDESKARVR